MYRKYTQALTLIELLAVMVIILIIAGMFVGVSGPASKSAKKRKAEVMISALEVAIGMYKADTGLYPPSDTADGIGTTAKLNDYLSTGGTNSGVTPATGWSGPYMEFKQGDISQTNWTIIDPWGNSYLYDPKTTTHTPTHNTASFDLWSTGPGGTDANGTIYKLNNW